MGLPQFMPSSFRNFALDGDADGRRDLWNDWADVFLSVGNYLKVHGWRAGEPIAVPADTTAANLDGLDTRLALSETVGSLRRRGLEFETTLPDSTPAMLVRLTVADGIEHRVGFANFYAITRYNRSTMYASAVSDLAAAIGARRSGQPMPEAATPMAPAARAPSPAPVSSGGWSTTTGRR
jgi:membrane-bound lytic murein transglycosylase B